MIQQITNNMVVQIVLLSKSTPCLMKTCSMQSKHEDQHVSDNQWMKPFIHIIHDEWNLSWHLNVCSSANTTNNGPFCVNKQNLWSSINHTNVHGCKEQKRELWKENYDHLIKTTMGSFYRSFRSLFTNTLGAHSFLQKLCPASKILQIIEQLVL